MTGLKEVPRIIHTSLADVPGQLRNMAERVEKGEHGKVLCCAICILIDDEGSREVYCYGSGPTSDAATVTALLLKLANETAGTALETTS